MYALHRLPTKSMPPGLPRRSRRVGSGGGFAVLVVDRTSYTNDGKPLEVVVFHHRPERYQFSVTLPRTLPGSGAGIIEKRDFA